jgi:hypothetical protein
MGETFFDLVIKEFRQKIMSSSKSIELGLTIYSKSGMRLVSIIDKKLEAK